MINISKSETELQPQLSKEYNDLLLGRKKHGDKDRRTFIPQRKCYNYDKINLNGGKIT